MALIVLFVIFRIFDLLISYLSPSFIAYLGFFPYKELLKDYLLPQWIYSFANFDGIHYLLIAQNGYSQYEQAFFPLYPILIRFFSLVFKNYLISSLIISYVCFLTGLFVFKKYLELILKNKRQVVWTLIFLIIFPSSFFFGAVYTESLFFLTFISSLYFFQKKKYSHSAVFAFFCSLTRLIGIFILIPFLVKIFLEKESLRNKIKKYFLVILSPIIGFASYCYYLFKTTGDAFFFFNSQPAFGANRTTEIIVLPRVIFRYIKIFLTAAHDFQYYISLFEFIVFVIIFSVLIYGLINLFKKRKDMKYFSSRLGLNLFSLINITLPTLTGTFSSLPRYALFSFSFFIVLSSIKTRCVKTAIAFVFLIFHILMLALFIQGYFVS